ncbi:MAG: hypothetical protein M3N17_01390 [Actinomycetota bacterium]|nr:hypothetical protein [Actinomycetota bacterium]
MTDATETPTGKLTAAMVLGITGGVIGIIAAFLAMLIGGLGQAFEAKDAGTVTGLGFAAIFIGVLGIVGGAIAKSRPRASAVVQLLAGIGGFVAVSAAWLISGPLLLIGSVLAFFGHRSVRRSHRVT